MEVYERRTREVIELFLRSSLTFPECIAALDAALAGLIPALTGEQIPRLRIVMLANNEIVMKEMERRGAAEGPKMRPGDTKLNMGRREISILKFAQYIEAISGATKEEQSVLDSLATAGYLTREDSENTTRDGPTYRITPSGLAIAESGSR